MDDEQKVGEPSENALDDLMERARLAQERREERRAKRRRPDSYPFPDHR